MLKLASAFRLPTRAEASKDAKFSEGEEASMLAISNISLLNAFFYLRGKTILRDLGDDFEPSSFSSEDEDDDGEKVYFCSLSFPFLFLNLSDMS